MSAQPPKPPPRAQDAAAARDWPLYFDAVAGKPPRETLLKALDLSGPLPPPPGPPPLAIDLGCGEGRDTIELLRRGRAVVAFDGHTEALRRLWARPDLVGRERLRTVLADFDRIELPEADLVNASYCLPFCPPEQFEGLWGKIVAAIRPGGRFAGQLFGERDTWAALPDRSHHRIDQARRLLEGFDIEHFHEEERDDKTATGNPKHWHVFHVIARKPAQPPRAPRLPRPAQPPPAPTENPA